MPGKNEPIDFFSREWEEKCRAALEKCSELDGQKIPESEKWWRVKQLLNELARPERRQKPRPQKASDEPIVEISPLRERRKLDFSSPEWIDKCREISEKCAEIEALKISPSEKMWRTRQLLKELTLVDKKRQRINRSPEK
jgi:hypothetical protein